MILRFNKLIMPGIIRICPYCNKTIKKKYTNHISYLCKEKTINCYICSKVINDYYYNGYKHYIDCYKMNVRPKFNIFTINVGNIMYKYITNLA